MVCILDLVENFTKVVEQISPGLNDLFREHIFLSVDPEVGEAFLGGIEDLGEVAEGALLVEDLVGF